MGHHPPHVVAGEFIGFTGVSQKGDQLNHTESVEEGPLHDKRAILAYDGPMYELIVYVPTSHLEVVKNALFAQGGGRLGTYEQCSFQVKGQGQFKPLAGSAPFLGSEGNVEIVEEWRVEMIVPKERVKEVIEALLASHPYETPAYHLYPALTRKDFDEHS